MVHNRKFWPQGSQMFGSCVPVFTVTSLQEPTLRSVDNVLQAVFFSMGWD